MLLFKEPAKDTIVVETKFCGKIQLEGAYAVDSSAAYTEWAEVAAVSRYIKCFCSCCSFIMNSFIFEEEKSLG